MSADEDNDYSAEVYVYTGPRGERVPHDVVRVRVDPSVTSIPAQAFYARKGLAEVELCEGLVEIGEESFEYCGPITKIVIPTSLRRIRDDAFFCSLRTPIRLNDGIERIGTGAFAFCIFTNFRVPPLINLIPENMLNTCRSMFSLELPDTVTEIGSGAFSYCFCLRNLAFPPNVVFGDDIFIEEDYDEMTDLQRLFGSEVRIMWELQHRFDGLPIHTLVYYHTYYQGMLQRLISAIDIRSGQRRTLRSKLDPTGNQQDCLGMTPLHILTCSSVHNMELYRVILENYPSNLITEDRWGALPLLYAFWGAAPAEIIHFLLDSYQLYYPDHVFNWTMMVETIGRTDTPKESIENLLCVKQMHCPYQPIDWEYLFGKFAQRSNCHMSTLLFQERLQYLVMCGMSDRVQALAFQVWRDHITNMIQTADYKWDEDNSPILHGIRRRITHFQDEYPKLKETTTILELAFWKLKINDILPGEANQCQKKMKTDESSIRRQCRITCGADVVIRHVLPYLVTVAVEESDSD
jgi:hypothetical protein